MAEQDQAIPWIPIMLDTGSTLITGLDYFTLVIGTISHFAINANGSESIYLEAVSSVSLALLAIQKRVYEHGWKDLATRIVLFSTWKFFQWQFFIDKNFKKNRKTPVSLSF